MPTHEFPLAEWDRVGRERDRGVPVHQAHRAHLRTAGGGSVVNISSIYAMLGGADVPPYHAAKRWITGGELVIDGGYSAR